MKKLLIVVDYQNDFVSGSLGFEAAKRIEDAVCEKIRAYQAAGDDVVYTLDTHGPSYADTQEGRKLPVAHCLRGTPGWELYGKAADLLRGCPAFEKPVFGSADLFDWLRGRKYGSIELCGVVSNICVLSNAVLARTAPAGGGDRGGCRVRRLGRVRCSTAKPLDVLAGLAGDNPAPAAGRRCPLSE